MKPPKKPVRSFAACDGAGMTLEEIAAELGVTHQAVAQSLRSGLTKLRKRPEAVAALQAMVEMKLAIRDRRETSEAA
jgi:DNA-directed RNA polymerase sigma subunit (sigma70/sigma32)